VFLITATKAKIKGKLNLPKTKEIQVSPFTITIVTDNFLSDYEVNAEGFLLTETPDISKKNTNKIIFSKIAYEKQPLAFTLKQLTTSGRPIYYHINEKGEFFCSTHISLLKKAGVKIEENKKALPEFFIYRYVIPPRTIYKGIYKILNGGEVKIKLVNNKWTVDSVKLTESFYKKNERSSGTKAHIVNFANNLLNDSLKGISYPPENIGLLMSGGLDSSLLCKLFQKNYNIKNTYSGGYPFESAETNTEKTYAISASRALGTDHTYYEPTSEEYLRGVIEAINAAEEPLNHLQTVVISQLIKQGIPPKKKLIISGLGADGLFGNELQNKIFRGNKRLWKMMSKQPLLAMLEKASALTSKGKGFVKFLKEKERLTCSFQNPKHIIWSSERYGSEEWVMKYFGATEEDIISGRYETIKQFENESIYDVLFILNVLGSSPVTQSIWSKIAESNGKAVYYPFDYEPLIDFVRELDWKIKLKKPKNILLLVAKKINLPAFIINRKKSGFGLNKPGWAEKGGAFEPLVSLASKAFDETEIRKMQSLEQKKAMTYWNILNYAIWKRLFINGEPLNKLLEELNNVMANKKIK